MNRHFMRGDVGLVITVGRQLFRQLIVEQADPTNHSVVKFALKVIQKLAQHPLRIVAGVESVGIREQIALQRVFALSG